MASTHSLLLPRIVRFLREFILQPAPALIRLEKFNPEKLYSNINSNLDGEDLSE